MINRHQSALLLVALLSGPLCHAAFTASPNPSTTGSTTLSWTAAYPYQYEVLESLDGYVWSSIYQGTSTSTVAYFPISGTVNYRLQHCYDMFGSWSCYPSGEPDIQVTFQVPSIPTLSGDTESYDGAYSVSWTDEGASTYELHRREVGGSWVNVYTGSGLSKPWTGQGDKNFEHRVRACESSCGTWSSMHLTKVTTLSWIVAPLSLYATSAAGATEFSTFVDDRGHANVVIPLPTVPGVRGMAPRIALTYSSGSVREHVDMNRHVDTLGYGWSVAVGSSITRCGVIVDLVPTDVACLDGEALIPTNTTAYWSDTAEYRLERDAGIKVKAKGTGIANRWFEVYLADGRLRKYGDTTTTRVIPNGASIPYTWSLRHEVDDYGNAIVYSYDRNTVDGTNYLTKIDYDGAGLRFYYHLRTDTETVAYGALAPIGVTKRAVVLNRIRLLMDGKSVAYTLIENGFDAQSQYYRVERIQSCGYDNAGGSMVCKEPLDVVWSNPGGAEPTFENLVTRIDNGLNRVHEFDYTMISGNDFSHALDLSGCEFCRTSESLGDLTFEANGRALVDTYRRAEHGTAPQTSTFKYDGAPLYAYGNTDIKRYVGFTATERIDENVLVAGAAATLATEQRHVLAHPYYGRSAESKVTSSVEGLLGRAKIEWANQAHDYGAYGDYEFDTHHVFAVRTYTWGYQDGSVINAVENEAGYCFQTVTSWSCDTGSVQADPTFWVTNVRQAADIALTAPMSSTWGLFDHTSSTLFGEVQYTQTIDTYLNDTTNWVIGFVDGRRQWLDTPAPASEIVRYTEFDRDGVKGAIKEIRELVGSAEWRTTTFAFDAYGNVDQVTQTSAENDEPGEERETVFADYLSNRYPQSVTDAAGGEFSFGYDVRFGAVAAVTDPDGNTVTTVFDQFGRAVAQTNPWGTVTSVAYNNCTGSLCNPIAYTDGALRVEVAVSNGSAQLTPTQRIYYDAGGAAVLSESEAFDSADGWTRQRTELDRWGQLLQTALPYFSDGGSPTYTLLEYDARGRTSKVTRPDGGYTTTDFEAGAGELIVTVEERVVTPGAGNEDQKKRSYFNAAGQLTATTDGYASADPVTTAYTYTEDGLLDTVTVAGVQVADMAYDIAGRRTEIIESNSGTTEFGFDGFGQLRTQTDAKGQATTFLYDKLGRLTQRKDGAGTGGEVINTWTYDPTNAYGQLATRSNGQFAESRSYLADGRLDTIVTTLSNIPGFTTGPYNGPYTVDYDYADGRLNAVTYPSGVSVGYAYTSAGYLQQYLDGTNVVDQIDGVDAFGNLTERSYANGLVTYRDIDPNSGRTTAIRTGTVSDIDSIQDLELEWRSNSSLHKRIDGLGTEATGDDRVEEFTYDPLNRLQQAYATLPGVTNRDLDFSYDSYGNLLSKKSNVVGDLNLPSYTYTAPHRLSSFTIGTTSHVLSYDANGNVTRYTQTGDDTFLDYDAANRVVAITVSDADDANDLTPVARDEFWYGPDGERFLHKETWDLGVKHRWVLYLLGGVFEESHPDYDPNMDYIQRVLVSDATQHRFKKLSNGSSGSFFEHLHRDHLGGIQVATYYTGAVLFNTAMDPFGARRESDWSADASASSMATLENFQDSLGTRGFTDHEHLDRTGFIHMNGRVYDPRIGRFVSPDPIVQAPGFSQSYNRYAYVFNNPLSYTDPSGFTSHGDGEPGPGPAAQSERELRCRVGLWCPVEGSSYAMGQFEILIAAHPSDWFRNSKATQAVKLSERGQAVLEFPGWIRTVASIYDPIQHGVLSKVLGNGPTTLSIGADLIVPGKIVNYFSDVSYDIGVGMEFVVDFQNLDAGFTFNRIAGGSFGFSFRGVVSGSLSFDRLTDQAGSDTSVILTALRGGVGASVDGEGSLSAIEGNLGIGIAAGVYRRTTSVFSVGRALETGSISGGYLPSGCEALVCPAN